MKFNSYDELLNFLKDKDLPSLEFTIDNISGCDNGECPIDEPSTVDAGPKKVGVLFNSFSDKPVVEFESGDDSYMVVNEFYHIANACSTTKVMVCGRELTIGVCEDANGFPIAKFDVVIDGKLHAGKEFKLVTDSEKYKNTIKLDD